MPTWNAPITWANDVIVTSTQLEEQLKENSEWLKSRPLGTTLMAAVVNTTSTSFAELVESRVTLTCTGGNVFLVVCGITSNSTTGQSITYDLAIDGTRYGDTTVGLTAITTPNNGYGDCLSIKHFTSTPPSVGSHVFSVWWKVSANTGSVLVRLSVLEIR